MRGAHTGTREKGADQEALGFYGSASSRVEGGPSLWHDGVIDTTRVDLWLWAVRLFKTRSAATTACRGGKVRVNRGTAKASTQVKIGDRIEAFVERERVLEVVTVIDKRVGPPAAAKCFVDHSPPAPVVRREGPHPFRRAQGAGRPTKRERRVLDRLRRPD
jgi:ribosome-associated heat shock protein Hsp15